MLLQAPQPATNGLNPPSAAKVARDNASLARMNNAAALAKAAVLGYCVAPASYADGGVNLVSDVSQTQSLTQGAMSTVPPGASGSGAGGYGSVDVVTGPTVVPMGQIGAIPPPSYPPLTTGQGVGVPVVPGASPRMRRKPCFTGQPVSTSMPSGASWGSASLTRLPSVPSSAWWILGGLALLAIGTRGK